MCFNAAVPNTALTSLAKAHVKVGHVQHGQVADCCMHATIAANIRNRSRQQQAADACFPCITLMLSMVRRCYKCDIGHIARDTWPQSMCMSKISCCSWPNDAITVNVRHIWQQHTCPTAHQHSPHQSALQRTSAALVSSSPSAQQVKAGAPQTHSPASLLVQPYLWFPLHRGP